MRKFRVVAVALVLVMGVACKKKKKEEGGGNMAASGSANTMTGSGSADMAGSGSGSADMAGSGSAGAGSGSAAVAEPPKKEMVNWAASDIKWTAMPGMDDKGPQMAVLWGDPGTGPNGWLIKIKGGSPGSHHTHSGTYMGTSISGAVSHFMDGQKKGTPLTPPAWWTIPGGVPHTSQCLGKEDCVALIQFNEGKSDFAPAEYKKDGKPDPGYKEIVAKDLKWAPLDPKAPKGPSTAPLWGDGASGPNGFFIKMPAGATSPAHTHSSDYHGVVIKGTVMNYKPDDKAPKEMGVGSYWFQPGGGDHITACKAGKEECISYIYMEGKFDFAPSAAAGGGEGSAAGGDMKGSAAGGDMKGSAAGDMKSGEKVKTEDKKGK